MEVSARCKSHAFAHSCFTCVSCTFTCDLVDNESRCQSAGDLWALCKRARHDRPRGHVFLFKTSGTTIAEQAGAVGVSFCERFRGRHGGPRAGRVGGAGINQCTGKTVFPGTREMNPANAMPSATAAAATLGPTDDQRPAAEEEAAQLATAAAGTAGGPGRVPAPGQGRAGPGASGHGWCAARPPRGSLIGVAFVVVVLLVAAADLVSTPQFAHLQVGEVRPAPATLLEHS